MVGYRCVVVAILRCLPKDPRLFRRHDFSWSRCSTLTHLGFGLRTKSNHPLWKRVRHLYGSSYLRKCRQTNSSASPSSKHRMGQRHSECTISACFRRSQRLDHLVASSNGRELIWMRQGNVCIQCSAADRNSNWGFHSARRTRRAPARLPVFLLYLPARITRGGALSTIERYFTYPQYC